MALLFSLFLTFVVSFPTQAAQVFELAPGSVLAYEFSPPKPGHPTFLLMPGVNRGTMLSDPAVAQLAKSGAGVITFNFSVQPLSLAELPPNVRARLNDVNLESLAEETEKLARYIAKEHGLLFKEIIPVSLSYSGAVSPLLSGFPLVIDVVPLTSFSAFNPQLSAYYASLKAAEFFNPIFGPGITRASLDAAYRTQWYPQVEAIVQQFGLPAGRKGEMVEGYLSLSRAVEGFSWKDLSPAKNVQRVLVLAEGESRSLLRDQVETLAELERRKLKPATVVIRDSGHIIPSDQPGAYAAALLAIAAGEVEPGKLTVLDPKTSRKEIYSGAQANEFLSRMMN